MIGIAAPGARPRRRKCGHCWSTARRPRTRLPVRKDGSAKRARQPASDAGDAAWMSYWQARHVSPPPPRDMFDPPAEWLKLRRQNLTGGAISDDTAARWVLGTLRRAAAGGWAVRHMRL